MANYQISYLSKYHGLKLLVDPMDHIYFKNPNIRYPKRKKNINTEIRYTNGIKDKALISNREPI